jgi:hypothetical protein
MYYETCFLTPLRGHTDILNYWPKSLQEVKFNIFYYKPIFCIAIVLGSSTKFGDYRISCYDRTLDRLSRSSSEILVRFLYIILRITTKDNQSMSWKGLWNIVTVDTILTLIIQLREFYWGLIPSTDELLTQDKTERPEARLIMQLEAARGRVLLHKKSLRNW